jgi:hypothetical protein
VSKSPEWRTQKAKAKAIGGIVLGLQFPHSLGLVHKHLTGNTIIANEYGIIPICGFSVNNLRGFS